MVRGDNRKREDSDSTKPKPRVIEKGIGKKNGKGMKLEAVEMGVEALSFTASGSNACSTGISGSDDEFTGYIFLCNGRTKPECFSYRVFGLPSPRIDIVAKIKPNTKLFLFDFDVKLLYGVYSATSTGTMNLEPLAFGGRFPAQVRFEIFKECTPMPESKFKNVIKNNYRGSKFRQNLSADQVDNLISLFRPLPPPPSASPMSLLSDETQSRKILHQEIEKQRRSPSISALSQQDPGSQYIGSRFGHSSYKAPLLSLHSYNSERPLTSMDWAHERTSVSSRLYPLSRLLPYNNLYRPELPGHSFFSEYSTFTPEPHGLSSRYTYGPFLSGIEINQHMGLPDDYYMYQNHAMGPSHGPPRPISALPHEPDRAAAAYWVAVANEIPQPSVHQTSDSSHNMTGQNSTLQYNPANLTSQSILDAYWEAKALQETREVHPGSSHMLLHSSQQPTATSQGSIFPVSYDAYGDPNELQIPSSQGGVFPTSQMVTENGNQLPTYASGPQQQVAYDPAASQMQHVVPPYYSTYAL